MRTILFKGYNKKNKEWLYGSYIYNRKAHFVAPNEFADGKTWEDYEIDTDSLGQFADMSDTEGRMIYEGDLVQFTINKELCVGVVYWSWHFKRFMVNCGSGDYDLSDHICHIGIKVVGNIYESK